MAHLLYKPLLITSITTSSVLTGCLFSLSYVSIPALTQNSSPSECLTLSQWKTVFLRGFHICPTSAAFSGLCCFTNAFLAYKSGSWNEIPRLITAGALSVGIVPYTLTLIVPVEEVLLKKEATLRGKMPTTGSEKSTRDEKSSRETSKLLIKWRRLNYGRTLLPLLGVIVAWSLW